MIDDWCQSAPGKIAAHPTFRLEWGGGSAAIFTVNTVVIFIFVSCVRYL